jgi:hypothetical protein
VFPLGPKRMQTVQRFAECVAAEQGVQVP